MAEAVAGNPCAPAKGVAVGSSGGGSLFTAAATNTRMAMVLSDARQPDHPIVFANQAFLALTGYAEAEVLGRNCRFLQCPETDATAVRQLREALAAEHPVAMEVLNRRRDGTLFWNALFIAPILGSDGRADFFLASQVDVTARHKAEELQRQAQRLEAVAQLAAGLAHDFNNVLQVVLGNVVRAESRLDDGLEARRALDRARRGGEHAAALTRQLLVFARRSRLQPRPLSLNALLVEQVEAFARAVGGAAALRYELDPGLPACMADPAQLQAAVLNLLSNARDAMPVGGRATVRTRSATIGPQQVMAAGLAAKPGPYVVLAVSDQGEGMLPEILAHAVEPFFTTKPGRGIGLGLATVHGFGRQSGGFLEIESTPGHGTEVHLFLPALPDSSAALSEPRPQAEAASAETGVILAVDDTEDVLDLAVHHLTARGYRVVPARSGEEALALLNAAEGARVRLLFTDIAMPGGMNGLMLAQKARAALPELRVLFTTGYSEDLAGGAPTVPGAIVLAKPYAEADLAAAVAQALTAIDTAGLAPPTAVPVRHDSSDDVE